MAIALWFLVGLVGGFLAAVFSGRFRTVFVDILASLTGSFFGGVLFQQFFPWGDSDVSLWNVLGAAIGSMTVLAVLEVVRRRRDLDSH